MLELGSMFAEVNELFLTSGKKRLFQCFGKMRLPQSEADSFSLFIYGFDVWFCIILQTVSVKSVAMSQYAQPTELILHRQRSDDYSEKRKTATTHENNDSNISSNRLQCSTSNSR